MASDPSFRTLLYPTVVREQSRRVPRFLVRSGWTKYRAGRAGPRRGQPFPLESVLGFNDPAWSVLPYSWQELGIWWEPQPHRPPVVWRGITCPLGEAEIWLTNTADPERRVDVPRPVTVLLPGQTVADEPPYPILGTEFFRRYAPTVRLVYPRFAWHPLASLIEPCGVMEWD